MNNIKQDLRPNWHYYGYMMNRTAAAPLQRIIEECMRLGGVIDSPIKRQIAEYEVFQ